MGDPQQDQIIKATSVEEQDSSEVLSNIENKKERDNVETSGKSDNGIVSDYDHRRMYGETLPLLRRDTFGNKHTSERQLKARKVLKKSHLRSC